MLQQHGSEQQEHDEQERDRLPEKPSGTVPVL
jgi:hypothetical protein